MNFHTTIRPLLLVALLLSFLPAALSASPRKEYGKIELLRDRWGVPNVSAATDEGAMYGLGFACAEDRLFQMCYYRLIMQGRVAEFFGDLRGKRGMTASRHDTMMRVLGFHGAAVEVVGKLDEKTRALLVAYCEGVNDAIDENRGRQLHLFEKYQLEPEPWTPADCLTAWWHLAKFFSSDGLRDRLPFATRRPAGRGVPVARNRPRIDDDAAVVRREDVTEEWIQKTLEFMKRHGLDKEPATPDDRDFRKFSHAWVIGGKKTTTGAAVLISDPQTPVWNPSMLYEFHLAGKTFNARGIGVPGSPIILIGYNKHVAWGMTALGADQADLFLLETDPGRPGQYKLDGEWREMPVRQETIAVKDGEPLKIEVRTTVFGPVVSDFVRQLPEGREVAVKRVPLNELDRDTVQGAIAMLRAASVGEFGAALAGWRFPSANCVFGDHTGSIGYWTIGAIPVRSARSSSGMVAHDGSSTAMDWQTTVPHDLLPHVIDPKRGYLVTANHRSIQSFYRLTLGASTGSNGDTDRGLRIKQRIAAHLARHDRFTPAQVLAIQSDAVNACKRAIVRCGYHLRDTDKSTLSRESMRLLEHLEPWYRNGAASDLRIPGAEAVNEMQFSFRAGRFPLATVYGGGGSGLALFAKTVRARLEADPGARLTDQESRFVNTVLKMCWSNADNKYGPDQSRWHALAIEATQKSRLGYFAGLDGFPSLDPEYDVSMPFLPVLDGGTILSQRGQAYTQFVPLHDPDASMTILPFGQSERPDNPFRFSTWSAWSSGTLHPAPLSIEKVRELVVRSRLLSAPPPARRRTAAGDEDREVLPGQRPTDPELEGLVRALLNRELRPPQVDAKFVALEDHVRGDADLVAQAISVFRLVIYLDYATEHARAKMAAFISANGGELPPERPEKYIRAQEERQRQRQRQRR